MIPFPLLALTLTLSLSAFLSQMCYRPQRWRRPAPCCLMVPSTAALTSWGRAATAAQHEARSPPPMPLLRYCSPTASTSWLWTGQIPAGRLLSRPTRRWQTWATRWLTDTLAVVRMRKNVHNRDFYFCLFPFYASWISEDCRLAWTHSNSNISLLKFKVFNFFSSEITTLQLAKYTRERAECKGFYLHIIFTYLLLTDP